MKTFCVHRLARAVIIAITLLGWFVLSNHCALGRMAPLGKTPKAHGCCHNGAAQPSREPGEGGGSLECCKTLHAIVPAGAKFVDVPPLCVVGAPAAWILVPHAPPTAALMAVGDIGPPRGSSFSELVLHRSLRAHAPPFFA